MYQHILNKFNIIPSGVIHIGAHIGEEIEHYINIGVKKLIYIEANPEVFPALLQNIYKYQDRIYARAFNYAITNTKGQIPFYVTDNKMSSSIFELKMHLVFYPSVKPEKVITVNSITFDDLINEFKEDKSFNLEDYNILVLDIQGAELMALKGAINHLKNFQLIVSEISRDEVFKGGCLHHDITKFLKSLDFDMIDYFENQNQPNDDAYYIKKELNNASNG